MGRFFWVLLGGSPVESQDSLREGSMSETDWLSWRKGHKPRSAGGLQKLVK